MIFFNTQVYKATDASVYFIKCEGDMEADTPEPIPYKNHYLFVIKIEQDKIIEVIEYFDPICFWRVFKTIIYPASTNLKK